MKFNKETGKIELNTEEEKAFNVVCSVLDIIRSESENGALAATAYCAYDLVLETMEYYFE